MKYIHIFLEKLSTNVTKYLAPPVELTLKGPHTSEWTNSRILEAWCVVSFGIFVMVCLPSWHPLQVCLENCRWGKPLTALELIMRCIPLVWKCPSHLCQRTVCELRWSELISGLRFVETPCNLYNHLLFSLGAKASNTRELSITKHPSDLKMRVLCWSIKDPTLNRFFVVPGVYITDEIVFTYSDKKWTSTFPTPVTLWLWPPADLTWAPLVQWMDEKTNGSTYTWWVAPESRYQEVVCLGVSSRLSSTKQASTT